jgi:DNA uptake protein ComE-like DNA-binding protein
MTEATFFDSKVIYKDKKTNSHVRILQVWDNGEWLQVEGADGNIFSVHKNQLIPDQKSTASVKRMAVKDKSSGDKPRQFPPDKRLNINTSTAQQIADHVRGIGLKTAQEIKDYQTSLNSEKFTSLDQLKQASARVDWDKVIEDDLVRI